MMEKDLLNRLQVAGGDSRNQKFYSHPMLTDLDPEKKKILEGTGSLG
jgi:hypothetical protein